MRPTTTATITPPTLPTIPKIVVNDQLTDGSLDVPFNAEADGWWCCIKLLHKKCLFMYMQRCNWSYRHLCMRKGGYPLPIRSYSSSRSPNFPDLARSSSTKRFIHEFFSTSSRLQTLDYPDIRASFTRPQIDHLEIRSIAARSSSDKIGYYSSRSRDDRVQIG